ncbi:hypothetical protein BKA82DRAFT_4336235 [Pisolithus tinctorius]|nr:hypothetical protein BKA82DRAFT_4336235 [Pisolithus tinctorius]
MSILTGAMGRMITVTWKSQPSGALEVKLTNGPVAYPHIADTTTKEAIIEVTYGQAEDPTVHIKAFLDVGGRERRTRRLSDATRTKLVTTTAKAIISTTGTNAPFEADFPEQLPGRRKLATISSKPMERQIGEKSTTYTSGTQLQSAAEEHASEELNDQGSTLSTAVSDNKLWPQLLLPDHDDTEWLAMKSCTWQQETTSSM